MKDKLFNIENMNVVVTGCSRGIGFEICKEFHSRGANVIGLSRSAPKVKFSFKYLSCDLANEENIISTIDEVINSEKTIDVLINCAGVTKTIEGNLASKSKDFSETINVNLKASYLLIEKVSEAMSKNKKGSIINVTSIAAEFGFPDNPAYVASKGALKQMTKAYAVDLGKFGVRVNSICPGYIHTEMTNKSFEDSVKHSERLNNMILNRWGRPSDLVGAAIFLSSESSSYITGADIVVDGGWCAKGMS